MTGDVAEIGIGSDHAGYLLKKELYNFIRDDGQRVVDIGTNSDLRTDYPDFAHTISREVNSGKFQIGILVCGTGQGMAMTANKYPGIRAALCWSAEIAILAREHNDANVLCLPGKFLNTHEAFQIVQAFLHTSFTGGRHLERIRQMTCI